MHLGRKKIYNVENQFGLNTYLNNTNWGVKVVVEKIVKYTTQQ